MKCVFQKGKWSMDGLTHGFSVRFPAMPGFTQREDHIENVETPISRDGYAYVSLLTREKVSPNVKLTTRCAFEGMAAPLLVLAKDLQERDGVLFYGDYLEVVLWKNGINVWKLWTDERGEVRIRNLMRLEKQVEPGVIHDLTVEVKEDRFVVTLDESRVDLYCGDIYEAFHLGITGCEGPCRFYDMEIQKI